MIHLLSNQVDDCLKDLRGAVASNDMSYYNISQHDGNSVTYYTTETILHETGHQMGLDHYGKFECSRPVDNYDPTDLMLRDIGEAVADVENCDLAKDENKQPNMYASRSSVMGSQIIDEISLGNGINPAFPPIDLVRLLPEVFRSEQVPAEPGEYTLSYGEGEVSALELRLPDDHPLREIDQAVSKLNISTAFRGGSVTSGEEYKDPRRCETNMGCGVSITFASDDLSRRYELDRTRFYYDTSLQTGSTSRVELLDARLGIGIISELNLGSYPKVSIVDYQTALSLAAEQSGEYEDYLNSIKPTAADS